MRYQNKQLTVFIGICIKDKEILMSQRIDTKFPDAHLKWDLPGGKAEFGETSEEALKREFLEETGIVIKVEKLIPQVFAHYWDFTGGTQQTFVLAYVCSFVKKTKTPADSKVKEMKWIPISEIENYDLLAGTYSSIFTASQLLVVWYEFDQKRKKKTLEKKKGGK